MFYIYILKSQPTGKYYIGCTDNIDRRLGEHNKGLSKYTRNFAPWKLVYTEKFGTLSAARKREKEIKSWKKRSRIEQLFGPIV